MPRPRPPKSGGRDDGTESPGSACTSPFLLDSCLPIPNWVSPSFFFAPSLPPSGRAVPIIVFQLQPHPPSLHQQLTSTASSSSESTTDARRRRRRGSGHSFASVPHVRTRTHTHTLTFGAASNRRVETRETGAHTRRHRGGVGRVVRRSRDERGRGLPWLLARAGAGGRVEAGAWTDGGCMHDAAHSLHLFGVAPLTSHGGRVT